MVSKIKKLKKKSTALFAGTKNRLSRTGHRFRRKLNQALGPHGSKRRQLTKIAIVALASGAIAGALYYFPGYRKMVTSTLVQAKSRLISPTSETLESSDSTSNTYSNSQSKFIRYGIVTLCIVAGLASMIWQYDADGQISFRFGQCPTEPEDPSYQKKLLKIVDKLYDMLPEPISQFLIAVAGIAGIKVILTTLYIDIVYGGPICYIMETIVNLLK